MNAPHITKIFWQKITTKADAINFEKFIGYYIGIIDGIFMPYSSIIKDVEDVKILTLYQDYELYEEK